MNYIDETYTEEQWGKALELALRFNETFPTINIRDNEPFYWLAGEIAELMASDGQRMDYEDLKLEDTEPSKLKYGKAGETPNTHNYVPFVDGRRFTYVFEANVSDRYIKRFKTDEKGQTIIASNGEELEVETITGLVEIRHIKGTERSINDEMNWDTDLPLSLFDVVALLKRRIEVHAWWRDQLLAGSPKALESSKHGVGTIESHKTYIRQYEAAIELIEEKIRCM